MDRKTLFLLAIGSLFIAGVFGYKDYLARNQLYFVIEMKTFAKGMAQIFFDTGRGIIEQDSSSLQVRGRGYHKYSFPVPTPIKSIRFDPINVNSVLSIKYAAIENAAGEKLKIFPSQSFRAVQQINKMDVKEGVLTIQTAENANDPILEIERSSFKSKISWLGFLKHNGLKYAGYAFLSFLILFGLAESQQKIAEKFERLVFYAIENPKKAITFIGAIATVVSCYPVVFFGMSFAHPFGVAALYGGPPWIPGLPNNAISENFRGTDVGATAWSIAPNSVIQHDSIFLDFEFPFWNRYVGGGIPFFAQGYSLIGDILHWIPVVLDGSAIGWDIKFVLSKAIFAVGMGLLVFRLTDTLLAGILISISSCFLGFFAFWFNHPAYFVLTYAPWVMLQWDRLGRVLALSNPYTRSCISQGLLLAAVTWLQLNAGTPKEGVITACFIHAFGVLCFLMQTAPKRGKIRSFVLSCGIGLTLVLTTTPYWLLFLNNLVKSFTIYDIPSIYTLSLRGILGFFDNFFFQPETKILLTPSVNLFVLLCMSSALFSLRFRQSSMVYCSWALFALAMAVAYGLIPASILVAIPFINKIQHLSTTFSVPMVVFALIIAGYGISDYIAANGKSKKIILIFSVISILGLWLVYAINDDGWSHTILFSVVTFAFVLTGFIQLYRGVDSNTWTKRGLIILTCSFLALHVRHGMHLTTGFNAIDDIVANPTVRPDFSNKSDAIEYVKNEIEKTTIPTRVIGEGIVLFPGYNSRLGLEGIIPVEAVRSKYYENLLTLINYSDQEWGWLRLIKSNQIAGLAASLDLLGIGYIVAEVGTKMPEGMKLVHSSDLDVWQRESVWPRAFFVNNIKEVYKPLDILEALADKSHIPFAAVESQFIPKETPTNGIPYQVVPAKEYRLTNNSTHFSVVANAPGIIVLGETYYPGDFVATVNGEKVDYIRVNEASKGIWVNKAGRYNVNFTYRPEKLNQAICISLVGLILLFILMRMSVGFTTRFEKNL